MSQTVKVHFFGEFRLESGTASLNEETIHSKKVMKLMAYLLLNHDRMISAEELGELIRHLRKDVHCWYFSAKKEVRV